MGFLGFIPLPPFLCQSLVNTLRLATKPGTLGHFFRIEKQAALIGTQVGKASRVAGFSRSIATDNFAGRTRTAGGRVFGSRDCCISDFRNQIIQQ